MNQLDQYPIAFAGGDATIRLTAVDADNHNQVAIVNALQAVGQTLINKNHDYGGSVFRPGSLTPDLPPQTAILVRLGDKLARFLNLNRERAHGLVADESLLDTVDDIVGYWILYRALMASTTWPAEDEAAEETHREETPMDAKDGEENDLAIRVAAFNRAVAVGDTVFLGVKPYKTHAAMAPDGTVCVLAPSGAPYRVTIDKITVP